MFSVVGRNFLLFKWEWHRVIKKFTTMYCNCGALLARFSGNCYKFSLFCLFGVQNDLTEEVWVPRCNIMCSFVSLKENYTKFDWNVPKISLSDTFIPSVNTSIVRGVYRMFYWEGFRGVFRNISRERDLKFFVWNNI